VSPCTRVERKLRDSDVYEDWEGSPAVLRSKARELRAELIAEQQAKQLSAIENNARIDRQKRQAARERAEAGRRQRERSIFGTRVSVPGEAPQPWADLPSADE
jgi:ribosomal protein L29